MVKIYTKTGDRGEPALFGGKRLSKGHPRIEAYGTVDELNAVLGVVRAAKPVAEIDAVIEQIQQHLFVIGAELASPQGLVQGMSPTGEDEVQQLEQAIDHFEQQLPELQQFILPGGAPVAAYLHLARCICRRAERCIVELADEQQPAVPQAVLVYLNRLGDLLFVLAREANRRAGSEDVPWSRKE
jgi:cob(I)alamin adenosyltransferase